MALLQVSSTLCERRQQVGGKWEKDIVKYPCAIVHCVSIRNSEVKWYRDAEWEERAAVLAIQRIRCFIHILGYYKIMYSVMSIVIVCVVGEGRNPINRL